MNSGYLTLSPSHSLSLSLPPPCLSLFVALQEKFDMETELYHRFMEYGVESEEYQGLLQGVRDMYSQSFPSLSCSSSL